MKRYNPKELEPKWQKTWAADKIYRAVDFDTKRPKYVMLTEFPYPSGDGLHLGHVREYTLGDIMARHKRQNGYNVLYPMGYDAFGLPTENYAIKNKVAPQAATKTNVGNFQKQFDSLGYSFDWDRSFNTTDPDYYRWTQWLFLQFYKKGLAYQDEVAINWCPHCKTGLANEEVVNGRHERCDTLVEKKTLKQWMLKITQYADRLIDGLQNVDYPSRIADQQINWIGRSKGAEIDFAVEDNSNHVLLHGFTARPKDDFYAWLKTELEAKGHKIFVPEMPDTDKPDAKVQAKYVLEHATFDEKTVLTGHSYGAVTALRVAEQLKTPIKKLVLAAGFAEPGFLDKERNFEKTTDWNFDFEKIKANVGEVVLLRATNDTAVPQERTDYLRKHLGGTVVDFEAEADHITGETEPVVLENVLTNIRVFTTRADTIFSGAFLVLAPEHSLVEQITTAEQKPHVNSYIKATQAKSEIERQDANKEKSGVFTGAYAINPANGEKLPVWIGDFVLANYGTGAVFGDIHDERDFEFLQKFNIPARVTVVPEDEQEAKKVKAKEYAYTSEGILIDSGEFTGMQSAEARDKIIEWLAKKGAAKERINYRLRDWIFSRQHYWGEPIPVIHCAKDGAVPVPDKDLPVVLPKVEHYEPTDTGESPLAAITDWVNVSCPVCGGPAKRETDTMPNWAGSSWYYLRYFDAHNDKAFADRKKLDYWGEVDMYLGGMEHTTLHLLYSRFWHQFFYDQGLVPTPEPYKARRGQGIVLAADGTKMSKSKGNIVNPNEILEQGYGADAIRLAIAFLAPFDQTTPWSPEGVAGTFRFLQRVWTLVQEFLEAQPTGTDENKAVLTATHKAIKKVSQDLHEMSFNTAVAALMEFTNELYKQKAQDNFAAAQSWQFALESLLQILAPFAPHMTEELWAQLGHQDSIHTYQWAEWDEKYLVTDDMTIVVQVNGKVRSQLVVPTDSNEEAVVTAAKADEKVAAYLEGKELRKTIYVPGKLVSFVV